MKALKKNSQRKAITQRIAQGSKNLYRFFTADPRKMTKLKMFPLAISIAT